LTLEILILIRRISAAKLKREKNKPPIIILKSKLINKNGLTLRNLLMSFIKNPS